MKGKMMKEYTKDEIFSKRYAILEWVEEDGVFYIEGLYQDKTKAEKSYKHLKNYAKRLFDKGIDSIAYGLWETTDERFLEKVKRCWNYNRESEQ